MSSERVGGYKGDAKAEKSAGTTGWSLRGILDAVTRRTHSRSSDSGPARWITYSSAGIVAAAGSKLVEGVDMEEVFDRERLGRAHQAVVDTPGSWSDEQTFIKTMERFHELSRERDQC